tara:strand:- start:1153 stop:1584 length:432 start_codon:yes stop_codon:yes gene_type:complete
MLDYKYHQADYYKWIDMVTNYAKSKYDTEVDMTSDDVNAFIYSYKNKRIIVHGATPPRDKLYILLHEVGHVARMMTNLNDSTFFMDYSGDRNLKEKTMTLMEEVLAWHKGEEIAAMLYIPIEKRAWQRLVNKTVDKYVKWLSE